MLLPSDVWVLVATSPVLSQKDVACMAQCCQQLRDAMRHAHQLRGIVVKQRPGDSLSAAVHTLAAGLKRLVVKGLARRFLCGCPAAGIPKPLRPRAMPRLERLELRHAFIPPGFWPATFDTCPNLRHVAVVSDFFVSNYASEVLQYTDLVQHGGARLETLDVEGCWLVMYPFSPSPAVPPDHFGDVAAACRRVAAVSPVNAPFLRRYRSACAQAPIGVDSPVMEVLDIEDCQAEPLLIRRMGPRTKLSVPRVRWSACWPLFDAGALAAYQAIRHLDLCISGPLTPLRATECLATLKRLPPTLHTLCLRVDMWHMRGDDSGIAWDPSALAHLEQLREFDLHALYPPSTIKDLFGHWMGLPAVEAIRVFFGESATKGYEVLLEELLVEEDADPLDEQVVFLQGQCREAAVRAMESKIALMAWLDRHPTARIELHGFSSFVSSSPHVKIFSYWTGQ